MLDALDLDHTEQAVYEALIDGHAQTVTELSTTVNIGLQHLRQALEGLETGGIVSRVPGHPAKFMAVAPEIALEVLFVERERQLQKARTYAKQLTTRFHKSTGTNDPAELVEIVSGRSAIRHRSEQLQRTTKKEFRGIDKPPYTVGPDEAIAATTDGEPVEADMLRAGVRYRVIYDASGLQSFHDLRNDIEAGMALGEEARVMACAPTKMMIFDDRIGMIPLEPASASLVSMIVVHPSGLLDALCSLFEDLWRRALPLRLPSSARKSADGPIGEPSGFALGSSDDPTPDEIRLLNLLATGMPDDAIAKHLGLSHRTVQRRLRALLDRLGAETRFQAGMQATLRGWLL